LNPEAWDAIGAWMDAEGLGAGPVIEIEYLLGGTQNIVARFQRGSEAYVLRRGPLHLRPASNDVMRREMRVLTALAGSDVPHPRVLATCPDGEPLGGAAFYLMEPVEGFTATEPLPPAVASDVELRRSLAFSAVDAAVLLHAVDHRAVGLADFGRPEGYLERQVPRWRKQLDGYHQFDGWPGPELPGLDRVSDWLEQYRPSGFVPGITHGDLHLSNLLYRPSGEVAAIIDWEMCTIGDPLVDIGWLLATWPEGDGGQTLRTIGGLPTRDEIIERYAARSGRDLSSIDWFEVLACWRLGIIVEGTYARACAGLAPADTGAALHQQAIDLFEHALQRLEA
jgi:aminoglycoside phosphotransferase (APT) family kinase protein